MISTSTDKVGTGVWFKSIQHNNRHFNTKSFVSFKAILIKSTPIRYTTLRSQLNHLQLEESHRLQRMYKYSQCIENHYFYPIMHYGRGVFITFNNIHS